MVRDSSLEWKENQQAAGIYRPPVRNACYIQESWSCHPSVEAHDVFCVWWSHTSIVVVVLKMFASMRFIMAFSCFIGPHS
mmetsp:Transcript_6960/g.9013  ORF Transcript_6960/g.9013 Transcript_6960/m.9013 type:complete len:80 (-) Transcript_6960:315-554(-)